MTVSPLDRGVEGSSVELLGSSGERRRPTDRTQDKSADPDGAHVVGWLGFFALSVALVTGALRQFPNDFNASSATASALVDGVLG